jgi:transposase
VLEETNDTEEIIQRVAALDIGKAELVCCIRVPGEGKRGKRLQEVRTYQTMTRSLLVLADRLGELGVTRVVMEATSDYWKAPVRHEAPRVRAEVKGLRLRPVAAGR